MNSFGDRLLLFLVFSASCANAAGAPTCSSTYAAGVCSNSTFTDSCGNPGACVGTKVCASSASPSPSVSPAVSPSPAPSVSPSGSASPAASPSPSPTPNSALTFTDTANFKRPDGNYCRAFTFSVTPVTDASFLFSSTWPDGTPTDCEVWQDSQCTIDLGPCASMPTYNLNSVNGYAVTIYNTHVDIFGTVRETIVIKATSQTPGVTSVTHIGL